MMLRHEYVIITAYIKNEIFKESFRLHMSSNINILKLLSNHCGALSKNVNTGSTF